MIFVDANVWMFAVGRAHQLREPAREILREATVNGEPLVTSAEVLQELLHVYLATGRHRTLDAALELISRRATVWSLDPEDVLAARDMAVEHPGLSARDLVHLSTCLRRGVERLATFDRALSSAFGS